MAVLEINKKEFEKEVLKEKGKVLVDFNATWCGPCRMMGPIIEELSDKIDKVKFVSIDIDKEEDLSEDYGIMSIPTIVLFENGEEVNRNVGFLPEEEIIKFIGEE